MHTEFIQNTYTKLKDYFTTNTGRKIFFFGLVSTFVSFTLYALARFDLLYYVAILSLVATGVGTLWDSMSTRYFFLKKIRDIQYEHLKEITDKQEAGEDVPLTPTFTDEEKRYLRRRKWGFVFMILFKLGLVIALFSLLLHI